MAPNSPQLWWPLLPAVWLRLLASRVPARVLASMALPLLAISHAASMENCAGSDRANENRWLSVAPKVPVTPLS